MKEKKKGRKRWLSYILAAALLFTMIPVGNFGGYLRQMELTFLW